MGRPKGVGSKIITGYLKKFPDAGSLTIAKIAYRENPEVWNTLEACRSSVRTARGNIGARMRLKTADKTNYREPGKPKNPFGEIPKGWVEMPDWATYTIAGPKRVLILSDIHIPYHSEVALKAALEAGVEFGADLILLNGDAVDFFAVSRWQKDPRERKFQEELDAVKAIFDAIKAGFPDVPIVWKIGNHEERWESYLFAKAPEVLGVTDFELFNLCKCSDHGVSVVGDKRPISIGNLHILHGHEYTRGVGSAISPARGLYNKTNISCVVGHCHQKSEFEKADLSGQIVGCWSSGCLSDLHPRYMPLNNWCHGFVLAEISEDGSFSVQNKRITDGVIS